MKTLVMKLLFLFLFASLGLFGQNYSTAIGIKGGYPGFGTLNVKHFISQKSALEGNIGGFAKSGQGSGAFVMLDYEINNGLEEGFTWHYGGGALIGFTNNNLNSDNFIHTGIHALIGIEYTFQEVPINCSLDTGPFVFFTPTVNFAWGGGLAIRYAIR